jgi:hypothetical protein
VLRGATRTPTNMDVLRGATRTPTNMDVLRGATRTPTIMDVLRGATRTPTNMDVLRYPDVISIYTIFLFNFGSVLVVYMFLFFIINLPHIRDVYTSS